VDGIPLFSGIHTRAVTMRRAVLNRCLRLYTSRIRPRSSRARFEVLVKTYDAFK